MTPKRRKLHVPAALTVVTLTAVTAAATGACRDETESAPQPNLCAMGTGGGALGGMPDGGDACDTTDTSCSTHCFI